MTRRAVLLSGLLAAVAPPGILALGSAQDPRVEREVDFVRTLAGEWGFIELAREELDRIQQRAQADPRAERYVAQAACEILLLGARRQPDREQRRQVIAEAIERFEDFIARYAGDPVVNEARVNLARACMDLGQMLIEDIERTRDPDKVNLLRQEAARTFEKGVTVAREAMVALDQPRREDPAGRAAVAYANTWLMVGMMRREWGRAIPEDRVYQVEQARRTLEDMILNYGEETPLGARGLLEYARCYELEDNPKEAAQAYTDTIESIYDTVSDRDRYIPERTAEILVQIMEQGYHSYTNLLLGEGKPQEVIKKVEEYRERMGNLKARHDPVHGDSTLLNLGRALFETGEPDNVSEALRIAREISRKHGHTIIGFRANDLLREIISNTRLAVSAEDLFSAAFADWQGGRYEEAIRSFKRVLQALDTPEDRARFGARSFEHIGRAFAQQERFLEAFMAFRAGVDLDPAGDPDAINNCVENMTRAAQAIRGRSRDPIFESLLEQARDYARRYGAGTTRDMALYREAMIAFQGREYTQAAQFFKQIPTESPFYEIAHVRHAISQYRLRNFDEARKGLRDYLDNFVTDPRNEIPLDDTLRLANRRAGTAEANFYLGAMHYEEATRKEADLEDPSEDYRAAIAALGPFPDRFSHAGADLRSFAYFYTARSHLYLEEFDKAQQVYRAMQKAFPEDRKLGMLALSIYTAQQSTIKAIEMEMERTREPARRREVEENLRAQVRSALQFALEYVETESRPQYGLLRNASLLAIQAGDTGVAERLSDMAIQRYGSDPEYADRINRFVKPDLARILLEKREFRRALSLLEDAIKASDPPNRALFDLKARALGGWIELGPDGRPVEVLGLERFEEAYKTYWDDYTVRFVEARHEQYSLEWYRFYLMCTYYLQKAAMKAGGNPANMELAARCWRIARATDNFETLRGLGTEGQDLYRLFQATRPPNVN